MYKNKYLKYKNKYLNLKNNITQKGGSITFESGPDQLKNWRLQQAQRIIRQIHYICGFLGVVPREFVINHELSDVNFNAEVIAIQAELVRCKRLFVAQGARADPVEEQFRQVCEATLPPLAVPQSDT
jgi:hypothetical protein